MSDVLITPLMSLPNPIPGQDPGPDYARNLYSSLNILDGHNHSAGSGNQINTDGILINADLPFNANNATLLRSVRFSAQLAPLSDPTDLGCLYESGVDLYYNDGNGNQVRITSGGSVNATSSGISSGTASAAFSGGVLVVDSNTNVPGNIQCGSVLIGDNIVSSNFVTVSAPTSLGASYPFVLPAALPGAQSFLTLDASGNVATGVAYSGGLTTANLSASAGILKSQQAAVGQQISSSCGSYTMNSTTPADVTNLSVSLTTTGRPVFLSIQTAAANEVNSPEGYVQVFASGGSQAFVNFTRGGTTIAKQTISSIATGNQKFPASTFSFLDTPGAGTYTYTVRVYTGGSGVTITLSECKLVAREL